jgi:hypothetical protein
MNLDEMKQVWQSQGTGRRLTVDADVLLPIFRRSKRHFRSAIFLGEGFIIIALVIYAAMSVGFGLLILRKPVPVLALGGCFSFACVCLAIAGYKAWDRFHQMQRRATASDPIRACLEEHLDWLRHEIRLWKQVLWWLLLPLAIGILVCCFSIIWAAGGLEALLSGPGLTTSLTAVFMLLGLLWGGTWFIRWYVRKYYEPRQRELESLLQDLQSD